MKYKLAYVFKHLPSNTILKICLQVHLQKLLKEEDYLPCVTCIQHYAY